MLVKPVVLRVTPVALTTSLPTLLVKLTVPVSKDEP